MKLTVSSTVSFVATLSIILISTLSSAHAKSISLYDEPAIYGKVIDTLDSSTGVILIFSAKDGKWVKVANPKNGNVGWVPSTELSKSGAPQTKVTLASEESEDGKKKSETYIMQFGPPPKLTPEQAQAMIKKINMVKETAHQSMQRMVNDMNRLFQEEWKLFNQESFPVIMPMTIGPTPEKAASPTTMLNKSTKKNSPSANKTNDHNANAMRYTD